MRPKRASRSSNKHCGKGEPTQAQWPTMDREDRSPRLQWEDLDYDHKKR
ncbi:hypothetical protein GA0061099_101716 [Bradyrhizobium yuanmingense]|uniref:Uncharacterized protein n=1 Tax=Bradyrhizobium yuanmingense TaxID=108015 RepID=A0A1C3XGC2_9BRAD|nr:hypothetical protein IQ15_07096 [Bradyrhizobium yuanmingense]SCB51327.1 hypothetical protein GA0061099_101716 [Bradyrhizobium yuanmingense]